MVALQSDPSTDTPTTLFPCSDDQSKRTILVTGGAGFIGFHTVVALLQRGEIVVIVDELNNYYDINLKCSNLDYLSNHYSCKQYRFYKGDICDIKFMHEVFMKEKPAEIIHLAARAGVRPSIVDPQLYIQSNIQGTTVLLDLCREYHCSHFLYASSSSVYGGSSALSFKESDCVDFPVSPYAATKKACELLAYTYHHLYQMNCTGLRFFTVYGPRGRPDMAPFKFIDRIYRGEAIEQYGDGSSRRDYTYIDDIVDGVLRSLDRPQGYQIYNIGNGKPVVLKDFIDTIERLLQKKAKIHILPDQPGDVPSTCADISKAKEYLGYSPTTSIYQGLKLTIDWYIRTQDNRIENL